MKGIMIQGTASDVGKSYITTAICRYLANKGYKVAPFKSQNMSNNSYVTINGKEIGRAQGVQAEAAKTIPNEFMNPILLKPKMDTFSEIVLLGEVYKSMDGYEYNRKFTLEEGLNVVKDSLKVIENSHDVIVIEGAGSPAEVNLNDREIVNMRVAEAADVDVILVVDIDRGGSFASVVGTLELCFEHKHRIKGILINKFRGDIKLLEDGLVWLEEYTGVKVIGVLPFITDLHIEVEDAQSNIFSSVPRDKKDKILDIGIIHMERVSNNTDVEAFLSEEDVNLRIIKDVNDFNDPGAIIIPGTKSTIDEIQRLVDSNLSDKILEYIDNGGIVAGICGGLQCLGKELYDPEGVDKTQNSSINGLGVFDIKTVFNTKKTVRQVSGKSVKNDFKLKGYEIHLGQTEYNDKNLNIFATLEDGTKDGAEKNDFQVFGTYLHNIFHNDEFRNFWLNKIRKSKGLETKKVINTTKLKEESYDKLAKVFEENIDTDYLDNLIFK